MLTQPATTHALMVDPEATPVTIHSPIPVPIHWRDEVKAGLDRDVSLGVIELVPVGEPVTLCHRMVVCKKKNGQPRRTVNLQELNVHCKRETHHTPSPFHQAMSVPSGKKKSVFDAWNGYHSVPIRECDRHLTTFITGSELGASGLLRECNHTCTLIKHRHIKHSVIYNTIDTQVMYHR